MLIMPQVMGACFGDVITFRQVRTDRFYATTGALGRDVINSVRYAGRAVIAFQAGAASLNANRTAIEAAGGVFVGSLENTRRLTAGGTRLSRRLFRTDLFRFETTLDEAEALAARLSATGSLVQETRGGWQAVTTLDSLDVAYGYGRTARFAVLSDLAVGLVTDSLLAGAFQYIEDTQNPYFSPGQRFARTGVASFGGFLSGLGGTYIGGVLSCGPAAPLCIAGSSLVLGTVWVFGIQPIIFDAIPFLQPLPRNLQPISYGGQ